MNTTLQVAEQIIDFIGRTALAAVEATNITDYDDQDTPGVAFDAKLAGEALRVRVTLQPTGAFKIYVFDPMTMATVRDEPDVTGDVLAEAITHLEDEL